MQRLLGQRVVGPRAPVLDRRPPLALRLSLPLQSNPQTALSVQRLSFAESVRKFRTLVEPAAPTGAAATGVLPSRPVLETGQFYCTTNLYDAVTNEISALGDLPTTEAKRVYRGLCTSVLLTRDLAAFKALRSRLLRLLAAAVAGPDPDRLTALFGEVPGGEDAARLTARGNKVYQSAWKQLKAGTTPDLAALAAKSGLGLSLASVLAVNLAERLYCGPTATRVGQLVRKKKGGSLSPAKIIVNLWDQSQMGAKIARIKAAIDLDKGAVVHVRVLSPYGGPAWEDQFRKGYNAAMGRWKRGEIEAKPAPPKPHHSLVLVGYVGDKFLFWDPDAATTAVRTSSGGPEEQGFGFLEHDASANLLWAPQHRYRYRVMWTGD